MKLKEVYMKNIPTSISDSKKDISKAEGIRKLYFRLKKKKIKRRINLKLSNA